MFHENQDIAWLDKIDKRYAWLKRHLLDFEEKFGRIFPVDWEVSERVTVQFCILTRDELTKIMARRRNEIDVKLLLFAISKTQAFEQLLAKRFTGVTLNSGGRSTFETKQMASADESRDDVSAPQSLNEGVTSEEKRSDFMDLIGVCFKTHLDIYTESIDRNLSELIERFVQASKQPFNPLEAKSTVFPRYRISAFTNLPNAYFNLLGTAVRISLFSTRSAWYSAHSLATGSLYTIWP